MIERRKTPRKDWVTGKDDVGRSVLEWKVDHRGTKGPEADPCARTYDFLERLEAPQLTLQADQNPGLNPYDTGRIRRRKLQS
jgi:hypothetical protein